WLASIMVMASCVAVLFGDKIRSQSKPFLYLFQLVAAKDPVHEHVIVMVFLAPIIAVMLAMQVMRVIAVTTPVHQDLPASKH
ncbi:hypothetical protein, partial [Aeromonas caviae]|uniref:hypothetical protein n=1 Tax=Aeromonas caviae TaxID=648 RepID=UPI001F3B7BB0